MALQMEMFEKRKKCLRIFNEYFNSFIDGHENVILTNEKEIRNLIVQIRTFNCNLAENDDLYDEHLVALFNTRVGRLNKFFKSDCQTNNIIVNNKSEEQTFDKYQVQEIQRHSQKESEEMVDNEKSVIFDDCKDIDALLAIYYIDFIKLTGTNWYDYHSQIMEFIIENPFIKDMKTKMDYLKKTVQKNSKALRLIENIDDIQDAIKILEKNFIIYTTMEPEIFVKYLIKKFIYSEKENDIEENYRQLLRIILNIVYTIKDNDKKTDYLKLMLKKIPNFLHSDSPYHFLAMMRSKLRFFDCRQILKPVEFEELEQSYNRLIDDKTICPICFKEEKCIRVHRIIRCRYLEKFIRKFDNNDNQKMFKNIQSDNSRSVLLDQTLVIANTNHEIDNQNDYIARQNPPKKNQSSKAIQPFKKKKNKKPISNLISLNKESNEINGFFTQQSSTSTSMPKNDESNKVLRKIIPITIVGKEDSIEAFIDEQNVEIPDAMIEHEYLNSLEIEFETVSDFNTPNHIIGYVKMDIAIGFLVRTINFAVFTLQEKDEEKLRISKNFLKKFSLTSPSNFEQRFEQIIERSLMITNTDDKQNFFDYLDRQSNQSNDETLQKLFDANFLIKSSSNIEHDSEKLLKITLAGASNNDYFLNPDNLINYGFDYDESIKLLKYKKVHIFLLACEIDSNQDFWDTMLIKFGQEHEFSLVRLPLSFEEVELITEIQKKCFKLLA